MENKNGQGIFYGVIGVATLVVAIIGATFAYFSASASAGTENLTGQTMGGSGSVLSLTVEKLTFSGTTAASNDLVPTNILTATVPTAVAAKCEATTGESGDTAKYTGCHMFRIVASAGSPMTGVSLALSSFTVTPPAGVTADKSDWNYAIYHSADAKTVTANDWNLGTATSAVGALSAAGALDNSKVTAWDDGVFGTGSGQKMEEVFYMVVWVNDDTTVQSGATNNSTGSYTGQLTLSTGTGSQIKATFSA